MTENLIEFKQISKTFDNETVIKNLSFQIKTGEIFVLVGPSGSGKTTTLKMINKLVLPSTGEILFQGKSLNSYDLRKLRWEMGYVLQQIALFPNMTVAQNITLIPEMKGVTRTKARQRANTLLEEVDLAPQTYANRLPAELSGGQQQRIGILRAIASQPPVVLMDEPFSALDPISRTQLQDLVLELHKRVHNTIVFVTHDMTEAMKMGDRIAVMHHGKIAQLATPLEIQNQPANDFVASFFAHAGNQQILGEPVTVLLDYTHDQRVPEHMGKIDARQTLDSLIALMNDHNVVGIEAKGKLLGIVDKQVVLNYFQAKLH